MKIIAAIALILFVSSNALAHPGKLDSSGCHKNKKTGEKHCHNKKPSLKKKN
jgi:hypothetical protein